MVLYLENQGVNTGDEHWISFDYIWLLLESHYEDTRLTFPFRILVCDQLHQTFYHQSFAPTSPENWLEFCVEGLKAVGLRKLPWLETLAIALSCENLPKLQTSFEYPSPYSKYDQGLLSNHRFSSGFWRIWAFSPFSASEPFFHNAWWLAPDMAAH